MGKDPRPQSQSGHQKKIIIERRSSRLPAETEKRGRNKVISGKRVFTSLKYERLTHELNFNLGNVTNLHRSGLSKGGERNVKTKHCKNDRRLAGRTVIQQWKK